MKDLYSIIQEKLRLTKHIDNIETKHSDKYKDITMLSELYKVGDKCLYVTEVGYQSQARIKLRVVEVKRILKIKITIANVFSLDDNTITTITLKNRKYDEPHMGTKEYLSSSGISYTSILIPADECFDLLDIIKKNDCKFDLETALNDKEGIYNKQNPHSLVHVTKLKNDAHFPPTYNDEEDITEEDLEEIKKYL